MKSLNTSSNTNCQRDTYLYAVGLCTKAAMHKTIRAVANDSIESKKHTSYVLKAERFSFHLCGSGGQWPALAGFFWSLFSDFSPPLRTPMDSRLHTTRQTPDTEVFFVDVRLCAVYLKIHCCTLKQIRPRGELCTIIVSQAAQNGYVRLSQPRGVCPKIG